MGIYDVFDDDEPAAAPPAPAAAAASSIYSAAVPSVDLPPRRGPSLREQAGLDPDGAEVLLDDLRASGRYQRDVY